MFNVLCSLSLLTDTSLICEFTSWWRHVTRSESSCSRRAWSASAPPSTMNRHTAMWSETFIYIMYRWKFVNRVTLFIHDVFMFSNITELPLVCLICQDDVCMHLTNYSINKNSENFVHDEDKGSKRYTGAAACVWTCSRSITFVICFGPQKTVHPEQAPGVTGLQHWEDLDRHRRCDHKDSDLGSSHPQA